MITEEKFKTYASIPIGMPETSIDAGGYVVIGSVYASVCGSVTLNYLSLSATRASSYKQDGESLSSAYKSVHVGLYLGSKPTTPLVLVDADVGEMACYNARNIPTFCGPGLYSIIVVNNLSSCSVSVAVSAAVTINIDSLTG